MINIYGQNTYHESELTYHAASEIQKLLHKELD